MADLERTVEIIFKSIDQTGSGLSSVSGKLNDFERSIGKVSAPLASLAGDIIKTEAAVLGLAAAYGIYAVSEAAKFESAQIDLNKVLSDIDAPVESFTKTVFELSETYGVASSSILQGIANFKQAGFTASESAKLQKDALDLVIAGDVEAARASEILVSSLKGFGAGADQATRFIEALNNVSNKYATDLAELATGMGRISPVAQQMGFTFEETTGLITPVIEVFRSGPEAANALRTGLLKLIDDAKPVGEALKKIGVSQFDANGVMRSGKDIFLDVANAFKTLDQNQKLVITSQLVGIEQASKMVSVFDNLGKVQNITSAAMERTGSVTKEVELRLNSAEKQVDKFKTTFSNLGIVVGGELLDNFKGVAGGASELTSAFSDIVKQGGLAPLFNALKPLLVDFEATLKGIAVALPDAFKGVDFDGLIKSFQNLGGEISNIFGDLDLTDARDLEQALQGIVDFIALLTNATAGVVEGFSPFVDAIKSLLESLADGDNDMVAFGSNLVGMGAAVNKVIPLLGFLGDTLSLLADVVLVVAGARGFAAFVPAVSSAATALLTFNPAAAAFSAAMGAIAFAIIENIKAFNDWQDRVKGINKDAQTADDVIKRLPQTFEELSKKAGVSIKSMDDFNKAVEDGKLIANEAEGGWKGAGEGVRDFDAEVEAALGNSIELRKETEQNTASLKESAESTKALTQVTSNAAQAEDEWIKTIENGQVVYTNKNRTLDDTGKNLKKVKEETDKLSKSEELAIRNAAELEQTLVKLASNERIKALEFSAKIEVANVEADAKRVVAAYEAISSEIVSTNDLLGTLNQEFANASGFDKLAIDDQIDKANDRADRLLDQQELLNTANVKHLNARTAQIERGGSDITINADNLSPELQAVLESLINNIRIKAIAEGAAFITG